MEEEPELADMKETEFLRRTMRHIYKIYYPPIALISLLENA